MNQPAHLIPRGPTDTVLPPQPAEATDALKSAIEETDPTTRHQKISQILTKWPAFLEAWATLGENSDDQISAYAAFRVGYHRGLDQLRAAGWRGTGMVRWEHLENRGFLRSLYGLECCARAINELQEAERCNHFLHQLDPNWPPSDLPVNKY